MPRQIFQPEPKPLKLNGKPLRLRQPPPTIQRLCQFLDAAAADDLFSGSELAGRLKIHPQPLKTRNVWDDPALKGYSARIGGVRYWGNPAAIAELLRQSSL